MAIHCRETDLASSGGAMMTTDPLASAPLGRGHRMEWRSTADPGREDEMAILYAKVADGWVRGAPIVCREGRWQFPTGGDVPPGSLWGTLASLDAERG